MNARGTPIAKIQRHITEIRGLGAIYVLYNGNSLIDIHPPLITFVRNDCVKFGIGIEIRHPAEIHLCLLW